MSKSATAVKPAPRVLDDKTPSAKERIAAIVAKGAELNALAITSSANHEKVLKAAAIHNILVAANVDIGRVDLINELWKGVTVGDRETLRLFFANVTAKYGTRIERDGKERVISMFGYKVETGFTANFGASQTNEEIREAANEMRRSVFSAGEAGLSGLTFGKSAARIARDTAADFDPFGVVRQAVSKLVKNGYEELAKIINKDIGVNGYNEQELADLKPDFASDLEKAKARVAKIEAKMPKAQEKREAANA